MLFKLLSHCDFGEFTRDTIIFYKILMTVYTTTGIVIINCNRIYNGIGILVEKRSNVLVLALASESVTTQRLSVRC